MKRLYLIVFCAIVVLLGELALYFVESMILALIVSAAGTYLAIATISVPPARLAERVYGVIGGLLMAGIGGVFIAMFILYPPGELFAAVLFFLLFIRGVAMVVSSFFPSREKARQTEAP